VTESGREPRSRCPLFPETPPAGSLPRRDCDVPDFAFLRSLRSHAYSSSYCENICVRSAKRPVRSFAHHLRCFAHPPRATGAPCATTVTMGGIDPEVATVTQAPFTPNLRDGPRAIAPSPELRQRSAIVRTLPPTTGAPHQVDGRVVDQGCFVDGGSARRSSAIGRGTEFKPVGGRSPLLHVMLYVCVGGGSVRRSSTIGRGTEFKPVGGRSPLLHVMRYVFKPECRDRLPAKQRCARVSGPRTPIDRRSVSVVSPRSCLLSRIVSSLLLWVSVRM
jgi:hypothetical protein